MNTIAISQPTTLSIWQRIVFHQLKNMKTGKLAFNLPNGTNYIIGETTDIEAEININDNNFFLRCVLYGDIGFGESYTAGEWNTPNITKVIEWFLLNVNNAPTLSGSKIKSFGINLFQSMNKFFHFGKSNTLSGSKQNISAHYDLNNEFFSCFLDPTLTYSSGYFKDSEMSLLEAQHAKYEALAKELNIQATDHVLEIGTGWGGNAIYIAKKYNCKVTTTTISEQQYKLALQRVKEEKLEDRVTVLLKDYRDLTGTYDKIVSIEMLEAVGHNYLKVYFNKVNSLLKKNGLLGLQVITSPDSRYNQFRKNVDWIQKHIFPGSLLPSVGAINKAVNSTSKMHMVSFLDFGKDYGTTLKLWHNAFNENWSKIKPLGFDEEFKRKWNYYLCYCEAAFNMRNISVVQLTYSRPNNLNY